MDTTRPFLQSSKGRWPQCHVAQPHIELKRNKMRKFSESLISSHRGNFSFFYTETNPRYSSFFSALDVQATGNSHQLLCCLQAAYLLAFCPLVTALTKVKATRIWTCYGGSWKKSTQLKQEHDPFTKRCFFYSTAATLLLSTQCAHRHVANGPKGLLQLIRSRVFYNLPSSRVWSKDRVYSLQLPFHDSSEKQFLADHWDGCVSAFFSWIVLKRGHYPTGLYFKNSTYIHI